MTYGVVVGEERPRADARRRSSSRRTSTARGATATGRTDASRRSSAGRRTTDRRRYTEIADFFVPHGYAVCLQDLRDRHSPDGTGDYFHTATPQQGEDGYDTIEWIAAQPWSNGRVGMVGCSYAGDHADPRRARAPAAPDRDLAGRRADERVPAPVARGRRDAAPHVLGASSSTRRTRRTSATTGTSRPRSGTTCRTCASSSGAVPCAQGRAVAAAHRRRSSRRSSTTTTRGAYDECWAQDSNDFTALLRAARRRPGHVHDRLVRRLPALGHGVLRRDGRAERDAAAADRGTVEPRRHAR